MKDNTTMQDFNRTPVVRGGQPTQIVTFDAEL